MNQHGGWKHIGFTICNMNTVVESGNVEPQTDRYKYNSPVR